MSERIHATYLIETPYPVERAAEVMAGEQSSGTFTRLANETDELRANHGAIVERIERLEEEKKDITDQIKEVFAESKGRGYDTKAMRAILRIRKREPDDVALVIGQDFFGLLKTMHAARDDDWRVLTR